MAIWGYREITATTLGETREFTVRLGPDGHARLGETVLLAVLIPHQLLAGPPGWTAIPGRAFWKVIGEGEADPVFTAAEPANWEIRGFIATLTPGVALPEDRATR
jgi:hypothetical protein